MKLRPIYDRIIVKPEEAETVSSGGLILIEDMPDKPPMGTIKEAGPDTCFAHGDHILFTRNSGTEVIVEGEKLLVMRESDVIAVL
jgi:chaperonin GroES